MSARSATSATSADNRKVVDLPINSINVRRRERLMPLFLRSGFGIDSQDSAVR